MKANIWLSDLLLGRVPVKQSDTSCASNSVCLEVA